MIPLGCVRIDGSILPMAFRDKIKMDLLIYPKSTSSFNPNPDPIKLFYEDGRWIGVPRGYFNVFLKPRGVIGQFDYSIGRNELQPADPIKPRPGQDIAIDGVMKEFGSSQFGGACIEAPVGSGKSPMALEVARRAGMKTLVSVHTSILYDQWIKEIPNFFPHWRVGRLQAEKIDLENKDIVIGTLQSLSMKDYEEQIYSEFGLIICDEIHGAAAAEYQKMFTRFNPKFILGVSGTMKRSDNAENVFKFNTGRVISVMNVAKNMDPEIYFIDTGFVWNKFANLNRDIRSNKFLEDIVDDAGRNEIIIRNAIKAAQAGRNVLILSKRVKHVESLACEIRKRVPQISCGVLVGNKTKQERELGKNAQIIGATVQLIGTGFNEPRLDTLIMGSPIAGASLEQCIGRIQRFADNKKPPMVLDICDSKSKYAIESANSRRNRYKLKGWKIHGEKVFAEYDYEHNIKKGKTWILRKK